MTTTSDRADHLDRVDRIDRLDPDELAALEDQREFLLRSLDDLEREHESGDLDDDDYQTLHDDYTARAAEVLRAIEERRSAFEEARSPRSWLRWGAVGVVVVLLAVGAGWWVARSSGDRGNGQTITGGQRNGSSSGVTSGLQRCIQMTVTFGRPILQGTGTIDNAAIGKATSATKCYKAILDQDPKNAEALTYRAWTTALLVQGANGGLPPTLQQQLVEGTKNDLAAAEKADPKLPDTHAFAAIVAFWDSRCADARTELARLDALHLPSTNQIMQLVGSLRSQVTPKACGS